MRLFLCLFLLLTLPGCGQPPRPQTLVTEFDQQVMSAAIARAQREVEDFVKVFEKGDGSEFGVKVKITQGKQEEHVWLCRLKLKGDTFEGTIENELGIVTNAKLGQRWKVKKSEVSDWKYERDGKIYGGYTITPLLDKMAPDDAKWWRDRLVNAH